MFAPTPARGRRRATSPCPSPYEGEGTFFFCFFYRLGLIDFLICGTGLVDMTKLYNRFVLKGRRRRLRVRSTYAERLFWNRVRDSSLGGFKIRRQFSIDNYIVDFYIPRLRLVIEIDGSIHDLFEVKKYDQIRQSYLEALGLRVIRFSNQQVIYHLDEVVHQLESAFPLLIKERDRVRFMGGASVLRNSKSAMRR